MTLIDDVKFWKVMFLLTIIMSVALLTIIILIVIIIIIIIFLDYNFHKYFSEVQAFMPGIPAVSPKPPKEQVLAVIFE